jgi:hypothetical protein
MQNPSDNGAQHPPGAGDQVEDKVSDPSRVPARRTRATPQQKEIAAILWANGRDDQFIQDELGLSPGQLRRIKETDSWKEVALAYRQKYAATAAQHRGKLLAMVPDAINALGNILRDPQANAKAQMDAIQYLFEQAKLAEVPETTTHEINVGFQQNNTVNNHIPDLLKDISKSMPGIIGMDPNKHVREGEDALPQTVLAQANDAERRAEIVEASFTGEETEDPSDDL